MDDGIVHTPTATRDDNKCACRLTNRDFSRQLHDLEKHTETFMYIVANTLNSGVYSQRFTQNTTGLLHTNRIMETRDNMG